MATTFEERLKAAREGSYNQLSSPLAEEPEESFDDNTLAPELRPPAPYEEDSDIIVHKLEEEERVKEGPTARDKWLGYTAATTFELGTILTTSIWLNRIRQARAAMKVNPASWTTPMGWAGLVGGEMVIGGLANWQAQEIKKAYRLQDAVYMSEIYAAALFNATPITTMVDNRKVFQFVQPALGERFGSKEFLKRVGKNTIKSTASGAALGLLESTFRQTVGLMMNERKNFDMYDAYASAGIGGTLNTALKGGGSLLNFWRQSGRWGRNQAVTVVERIDDALKKEEQQVKDQIKKTEEELPKEVKFGIGGGIAVATKNQTKADLAKKLRAIQEAIELNKQSAVEIKEANAKVDEAEANPKPIEEPKPLTEAELKAVDKKAVEEPEVKPVEVEEPDAAIPEEVKKPTVTEESKAPKEQWETTTEVKGEAEVEVKTSSWKGVDEDGSPVEVVVKWYDGKYQGTTTYKLNPDGSRGPSSESMVNKVTEDKLKQGDDEALPEVIGQNKFFKDTETLEARQKKLEEAKAKLKQRTEKPKEVELPENEKQLQSLYARIKEAFSTGVPPTTSSPEIAREAGQLVQNTLGTFNRAIKTFRDSGNKETRALEVALDEIVFLRRLNKKVMDPLDTMHARGTQAKRRDSAKYDYSDELSNRAIEEDEAWARVEGSLRHAIENAEDGDLSKNIKDALDIRPRFKALGEQFDRKATADYKRKLREATEKEPKEVSQEVIVAKLRDKLKEAQQEFAGLKPEAKAKKVREKSEQEIDIQKRLDFYATGKREAKQIAQEENRLETYLELLEEGDIAKIRQQVGPAPDWANKKAVASYLSTIRKVNNKTKKLLQKQVVESDISLQDPNKVAKAEAKKKARLQKRLKELRARAFQLEKIRPKDKTAKAEVNAEIEELERTVKFHEDNERDALKLEAAYKERARLLKVETGPLGQQRAEITKPKGPTKVPGELEKVNKDISFLKSNIRSRVKEIDKAALEMTDEFQAAKAEKEINKQISKLDDELQELRESFAKEPVEPGVKKPIEKDPRIKEREDKIAYYKEARRQIITLKKKYAERARLLELETGPLGAQRAEVTPKPTGPKKSAGIIAELDEQIAFLRRNMRQRVDEIDRARLEMTQEFQEAKMLEALRKKRAKLKDRLEARRQRAFDDEDLDKRAYEAAGRKFEETDPISLEYQEKIKFYDKIEAEALKKKELREQLARQAEMEGRGVVSEIRAHITPKPTGPKPISSNDELRRQIRQSDSRMRAFIKDLDEAQDAMRDERIYEDVSKAIIESAKYDVNSRIVSILRAWANARVYAMIWQSSSVFASFLGGVTSTFKQIVKPFTEFAADVIVTRGYKASDISAVQTFKANVYGLVEALKNWEGTGRAMMRTAKDLESATGGAGRNKFTREKGFNEDPVKLYELSQKQARDKRLRGEGVRKGGVASIIAHLPLGRMFTETYKLPLRGIMPLDEMFRRQLVRAELMSEQWKIAYDTYPNDTTKAAEYAAQLYDSKWTKDNGIDVLSDEGINATATDTINKELLFDSNVAELDHREIARPFADAVLEMAKKIRQNKDNPAAGALMHLLMPIVTVVARGAGRTTRVSLPFIPASQAVGNPYNRKINYFERLIDKNRKHMEHPDQTPERRARLAKANEEYEQKIKELKGRRIAYHRDAITDTLWGSGMMAAGYATALLGLSVGTLSWMTKEQREKFRHKNPKAKPNSILGWQYKEFLPISGPFAIGADLAMVSMLREEEDDTGKPLLQKHQTEFNVALRSLIEMGKEVPVAGGLKSAERVLSGDDDMMKGVLADWGASFGLVPAQMRKLLAIYFGDGDIDELKGGTIEDRMLYRMIGYNKTGNKKVDHFGEDMPSQTNLLQAFFRLAPDTELERTAFDDIYSEDIEGRGQLKNKPTSFGDGTGIDMYKFVDNTGMSLHYRFALELRKTGVKDTVNNLIQQSWWRDLYEEGSKGRDRSADPLSVNNEAIDILNETLGEAYNETVYRIIDNKDNQDGTVWLDEFLHTSDKNKEGTPDYEKYGPSVTLRQMVDRIEKKINFSTGAPKAYKDIFQDYGLDELLESNPQMQRVND